MSGKGEPKKNSSWFNFSGRRPANKTTQQDFDACAKLTEQLNNAPGTMFRSVKAISKDGQRRTIAGQVWVPGFGLFTTCNGTPASVDFTSMKNQTKEVEVPD